MKPKSRKEILEICQSNFYNYSLFSKSLIIIAILLSAVTLALYICMYIVPTGQEIINGNIVGWHIVWRIGLAFILYWVWKYANIIFTAIGGYAACNEEGWEYMDFSMAWMDMYEYEYLLNEDSDEEIDDENFDK